MGCCEQGTESTFKSCLRLSTSETGAWAVQLGQKHGLETAGSQARLFVFATGTEPRLSRLALSSCTGLAATSPRLPAGGLAFPSA